MAYAYGEGDSLDSTRYAMNYLGGGLYQYTNWEGKEVDKKMKKKDLIAHIFAGRRRMKVLQNFIDGAEERYGNILSKYEATKEYKAIQKKERLDNIFEELLNNRINPTIENVNRVYNKRFNEGA